jgi:glyoxylase-like metal-dependent hydrolase (beta-lactamase superfamily II)
MAVGSVSGPRRKVWIAGSLALLGLMLAAAYVAYYQWRVAAAADRARPLRHSAMAVVPGIFLLGGLSPSAAYVVETSEGLILVDSGLAPDAGPLRSQMAELGLDWRRVRAILLTHAHGDHIGGAGAIRSMTGATVYAGAGDAAVLRAGGPREAFFSTFSMPDQTPHPTAIDVELRGGETIAVGDVRVRAIASPGHTPGSVCYLVERHGLRSLFAGDVIMMLKGDEPPRTEQDKPLGTYSAYLPPRYRGDARESLATLRNLRRLPVPDLVFPGHPAADRVPQSPRLSQARWESMLERGIRDMETLLARFETDGPNFLDGNPKRLRTDLDYLGDFRGSAVYGFAAGSRYFLVDAPGGAGLVPFVTSRLRRLGRETTAPAAVLLTACGPRETAGLKELVETWHLRVLAASAGVPGIRASCPPGTDILPAEELAASGWFPVATIPLGGRGVAPIAYRITLGDKSILFSGRIPVRLSQEVGERLIADLLDPSGDVRDYLASLSRLHQAGSSDFWLPAIPTHGQNANLYDHQWIRDIEDNLLILRSILASTPSRQ